MILPDDYIRAVGLATHPVGGLFVLDCIASGTIWVDMVDCEVDVLISAPQKGWSSSPCAGLVMLNRKALDHLETTTSNSFALGPKKSGYKSCRRTKMVDMPTTQPCRLMH